ncbi:serine/threonine protein kinase [Desertihabitans brevis]|uniref:non-specific serine/threonine protein kinase n=1 Tax=Desertihabitans brevis TaxID=2268447 RepID=A0A367YWR5_9ACTN|nr:serine/threonine-protein kinase [Desertihabitans brevis]RCK70270.1 serine/threonine protein kinase [Desertihabitans brevis]
MVEAVPSRYELRRVIAEGGMGTVWLARDHKLGADVAAKVLRGSEASAVLRFVREQGLRVRHRHVVSPQGWSADDDHVVMSMPLVRGGSLQTLSRDHGPLPEPYVAVLVDQLLDGLAEIHRHGVVHRDLKPANVLLEPTGSGWPCVRIGDFGIAAVVGEPRFTVVGQSLGTLGFMAPEQARGAEPDPRQDLFAVGVLGRCLLTGLPPGQLPTDPAGAAPGAGGLWPFLQWLSSDDPARRPASAEDAREELRRRHLLPPGPVWQQWPDPPEVFDQIAELEEPDDPGPQPVPPQAGVVTQRPAGPTSPVPARSEPDPSAPTRPDQGRPRARPQLLRAVMVVSFVLAGLSAVLLLLALLG